MRMVLALFAFLIAAAAARAECRDEVTAAFTKQREAKSFRMEASVIGQQGPMKMTVDYILPDRIHQKVDILLTKASIEAILIGRKAWAHDGQKWGEAPADVREELDNQLRAVAEETSDQLGQFECMGKQMVEGKELSAYRAQEGPKDMSPGADKKAPASDAVRVIYVDPATGLPARSILARREAVDRPLFKAVYSYPTDLKIEAPGGF